MKDKIAFILFLSVLGVLALKILLGYNIEIKTALILAALGLGAILLYTYPPLEERIERGRKKKWEKDFKQFSRDYLMEKFEALASERLLEEKLTKRNQDKNAKFLGKRSGMERRGEDRIGVRGSGRRKGWDFDKLGEVD